MGKKIVWDGEKRELLKFEQGIIQYYKELAELWNKLSDHITEPTDRRYNYYWEYHDFFRRLVFMWDAIRQTQQEYEARLQEQSLQIQSLKAELKKWTEQQQGRKPLLTS